MTKTHYDVAVVGAGIFGSCAAYHSQKLGKRTLLLDQFALGHKNGSSHGQSRIIRYAHVQEAYVPLVDDSYHQIAQLEAKRSEQLWRKTGLLWVNTIPAVTSMSETLTRNKVDHEVISGDQISSRYPQFKYDDTVSALIDPMGGVLFADKWLNAFQDEFRNSGGTIHEEVEVLDVKEGNPVELATNRGTFTADRVIVTAGSWIAKLFPNFPIKVQPQSVHVAYYQTKNEEEKHLTEMGSFPVFIGSEIPGFKAVFGLPAVEHPHMIKVCANYGASIDHGADHGETVQQFLDIPTRYVAGCLPKMASTIQKLERCKYTMSSDKHYVIDRLPEAKNIFIGGCCSGSGFKTAPAIGRALAEMAVGQETSVDVSFFSFKRFL